MCPQRPAYVINPGSVQMGATQASEPPYLGTHHGSCGAAQTDRLASKIRPSAFGIAFEHLRGSRLSCPDPSESRRSYGLMSIRTFGRGCQRFEGSALTRLARCECALTAREPDGELTRGELTLACQPVTGLGRSGRSWPPAAPPGKGQSGPDSAGQRAGSAGRTPGSSLTRRGPDARPAHRTRVVRRGRKRHRAVHDGESPSGRVGGSG